MKKQRAFTLIELLVVIAVIGFLASIVLISVKGIREKAEDAKVAQEVEQIVKALMLYVDSHDEDYPSIDTPTCLGRTSEEKCALLSSGSPISGSDTLKTALNPYLSNMPYPKSCKSSNNDYFHDSYVYNYSSYSGYMIVWPIKNTDANVKCPGTLYGDFRDSCGRAWCVQYLPSEF